MKYKTKARFLSLILIIVLSVSFMFLPGGYPVASAASVELNWPCASAYTVTCMYYYKSGKQHSTRYGYSTSMDIGGGGDIIAAESGTVVTLLDKGGESFGKYVEVQHADGSKTLYAHMSSFAVSKGQSVNKGQKIGVMGQSGNADGVHLHFEWSGGDPWKTFYKGKYDNNIVFEQNVRNNNQQFNSDQTIVQYIDSCYEKRGSYYYYSSSPSPAPVTPPAPSVNWTINTSIPTPIIAYPAATSGVITLYDNSLTAYSTTKRYISWNDQCTINAVYQNGYCSVTYPTSSGENTEKAAFSAFVPGFSDVSDYSPGKKLTAYIRSDKSEVFGSVFESDSCKRVGSANGLYQIIYPVVGGYKLGWVDPNYSAPTPDAPEPARPPEDIPGAVASGVFAGKSVVAMAPKKITFSSTSYIDEGDLCRLTNIDSSTGLCTVEYPSGSNDVFSASKTRFQTVSITEFIEYNASFGAETTTINKTLTAYPTSAMTKTVGSYATNWSLDAGDTYTTINKIGSATEVLYYCTRGNHAGYWKLGWVYLDYFYLDLNGNLDGNNSGGLGNYGTADVYINGLLRARNVNDFYSANGLFPDGSTYEIKNIQAYNGYTYHGVSSGSASGSLTGNTSVYLRFTKKTPSCTGIAVTKNPSKTTYLEGESLNTAGLTVMAYLSDGSSKDVTSSCSFSGYSSTPGNKTVSVSYGGKMTAFSVTVKSKSPTAISIVTAPSKTAYYIGDVISLAGLSVKATFDNNTSAAVSDYIVNTTDVTSSSGIKAVTVTYCYNDVIRTTTFDVTVAVPTLKLSYSSLTLEKGKSGSLTATTLPASQTVTWQSSNPAVATVANGVVTAVGAGAATITATFTYQGHSYSANAAVTVNAPEPVPGGNITVSSAEAHPGETVSLNVSLSGNPGINAFVLDFDYDTTRLQLKNVAADPALGGQFQYTTKAVWVNGADVSVNGTILTLTFDVLASAAEGNAVVSVICQPGDISNYAEQDVLFTAVPGTITVSEKHEHTWDAGVVTVAPTLDKAGVKTFTCTVCHATKTETIPKLTVETLASSGVTLSWTTKAYNGAVQKPAVTVRNASGYLLTLNTSYTVSYSADSKYPGSYKVTVTGKGRYTGTVTKSYSITKATLASSNVTLSWTSQPYNGSAQKPAVTVKSAGGSILTKGTSYTVSYSANSVKPNSYTVTVTGAGNYTGKVSKTYTIAKATLTSANVTLSWTSKPYTGSAQKPTVTVKSAAGYTLTEGTSYTVSYSANSVKPNSYTVTVTGAGNYTGTVKKTYTIAKATLASANVTLSWTSKSYTGSAQKPTVTVKSAAGYTLTAGTSYTVSYSAGSAKPGSYTLTVTGAGNYTGTVKKTYSITKGTLTSSNVTLSWTSNPYNGYVQQPVVTVKNANGETVTQDVSYTVSYSADSKKLGTYSVTVTGMGNFTGTVTKTYEITAQELKAENIILSKTSFTYDGKAHKPTVTVKNAAGATLTKDVSYVLTSSDGCVNKGTYYLVIVGQGNYTGMVYKTFTIK